MKKIGTNLQLREVFNFITTRGSMKQGLFYLFGGTPTQRTHPHFGQVRISPASTISLPPIYNIHTIGLYHQLGRINIY